MSKSSIWIILVLLSSSFALAAEPSDQQPTTDGSASRLVAPPTIYANPVKRAPLIAIIEFATSQPVKATLVISDGERRWQQPWTVKAARKHRIAAMGLRPDREHTIRVQVLVDDQSVELGTPMTFRTPPLPADFPPLHTLLSRPQQMEPGLTLFSVNQWRDSVSILDYGYLIVLDNEGEVVWYCNTHDRVADIRILDNGHLLYLHGNYRYALEIDIMGRDIRRWYGERLTVAPDPHAIPLDVDTLHHEIIELPNKNFMTLATELVDFEKFPTSESNPEAPWKPAHVVCDRIVEFQPDNGRIVNELDLLDVLDPKRFGYMALSNFWKEKYSARVDSPARDWSHANALQYVAHENAVIVSVRHLDCVIKIDWDTKQIRWILGDPEGWDAAWQEHLLKPVGKLEWPYHQHAPQLTPRGTLLMFDNGNYRARPYHPATLAKDNHSRVVEFEIDEQAMTVKQVFEFDGGPEERFYSPFYGEADWLPQTGNILVTDGGHIELEDGTPHDDVPADRQWARIFEITRDAPARKVFEVSCDSGYNNPLGWSIYRSIRIANLIDPFAIDPPAFDDVVSMLSHGPHKATE
ncbi:MAG: aryl-sulfate sulfotransferase [Aureliella sp.]